jgi:hypothetical protein
VGPSLALSPSMAAPSHLFVIHSTCHHLATLKNKLCEQGEPCLVHWRVPVRILEIAGGHWANITERRNEFDILFQDFLWGFFFFLAAPGLELRASHLLGRYSTVQAMPPACLWNTLGFKMFISQPHMTLVGGDGAVSKSLVSLLTCLCHGVFTHKMTTIFMQIIA